MKFPSTRTSLLALLGSASIAATACERSYRDGIDFNRPEDMAAIADASERNVVERIHYPVEVFHNRSSTSYRSFQTEELDDGSIRTNGIECVFTAPPSRRTVPVLRAVGILTYLKTDSTTHHTVNEFTSTASLLSLRELCGSLREEGLRREQAFIDSTYKKA